MNRLQEILETLDQETRDALTEHINGGTSAYWIAETLTRHGHTIGPTTIKTCRQRMKST